MHASLAVKWSLLTGSVTPIRVSHFRGAVHTCHRNPTVTVIRRHQSAMAERKSRTRFTWQGIPRTTPPRSPRGRPPGVGEAQAHGWLCYGSHNDKPRSKLPRDAGAVTGYP